MNTTGLSARRMLALSATMLVTLAIVAIATAGTMAASAARARPDSAISDQRTWIPRLVETFEGSAEVNESMYVTRSPSPAWWLVSGAGLTIGGGVGSTWVDEAPEGYYRMRYELRKPQDSDGGRHPQNLFRLVTREQLRGATRQECYFRILEYRLSSSPERYAPNGLLLFNRYQSEDEFYYAGIRVDGHAIVKKKSAGTYYTLAEKPVFDGKYDRYARPILLPQGQWIGLRTITEDRGDGSVAISLFVDRQRNGDWEFVLRGIDAGVGREPFRDGRGGIRTDFMDVEFDEYRFEEGTLR